MDAAAIMYDRYAPAVLGLARRILGNARDAEDVAQEVFAQAWRTAASYDGERGNVASWLLIMARTRAIDQLRARRARPDAAAVELPRTIASADPLPQDVAIAGEQGALVRRALSGLSAPQRTALELAYFEGLTQSEIAARLDEPLGTVKTRIRTALMTLRERLRT